MFDTTNSFVTLLNFNVVVVTTRHGGRPNAGQTSIPGSCASPHSHLEVPVNHPHQRPVVHDEPSGGGGENLVRCLACPGTTWHGLLPAATAAA